MDNLTAIINTCDKFSDIWDIQCSLLNTNWSNRAFNTILLTDECTPFRCEGIDVVSAGKGKDMVDRLRFIINQIDTEFVFITLDDYFLVKKTDADIIQTLLEFMHNESVDYIRLYKYPKSRETKAVNGYPFMRQLTFDKRYDVNLYPGLWRTSFLKSTLQDPGLNAWEYEVSLTKKAIACGAKCAWCKKDVFPILDAVRKGKLLHKSKRFIEHYGHYSGAREVVPYKEELRLLLMRCINTYLPDSIRVKLKSIAKGFKVRFYSKD